MNYTPRQIAAWLYFLRRYQARRRAESIATQAIAASGHGRSIKAQIEAARKAGE